MRKATILVALVLLGMTSMLFGELAVIGPDLKSEVTKQAIARQDAAKSIRPWSNHNNVMRDSELVPSKEALPEASALRFDYTIDYAGLQSDDVGSGWGGFIFGPSDSALAWFRPSTECLINEIGFYVHSESNLADKTVYVDVYTVKDDWWNGMGNGTYDFSYLDEVWGDTRPHDELLLHAPVAIGTANGPNTLYTVDVAQWTDDNLPIDIGSEDFIIVIGMPEDCDGDLADLYYGNLYQDLGQYHGFKYYYGAAGWKSRFNFAISATVDYYGDPPPFIEDMSDLSDVYLSDDPGPYATDAKIYDLGTGTFPGGLTTVELQYWVNGVADTADISDQIPSADSMYVFEFTGLAVGDFVEYQWYAEDNGAEDVDGVTHMATSFPLSFTVREASDDATILLIDDNGSAVGADYWAPILDAGGWIYDYWDVATYGTPTAGILANYSSLLWAQANSGAGILGIDGYDAAVLGPYLDAGGNLFISSSDYIGDSSIEDNFEGVWTEATHQFLIDYFHVSDFNSDSNVGGPNAVSQDTLYMGVEDSPISGEWAEVEFEVDPTENLALNNWADEVVPTDDADVAFMVFSIADDDWVEAGVLYEGDYKMVFLPFQYEAITDDDIRYDVMANVLALFGEKAAPLVKYEGGSRYAQAANAGDVMVYGSATDGDGEVVSMGVDYTLDDGDTWMSVDFVDGMASIPALSVGDDCYFMVTATDNDDLTGYSDLYNVWKIDFTPAGNVLYVGDDYYTWYYEANYDSVNYVRTMEAAPDNITLDYYDLDELYLMDTYSILAQYDAVIWNAYADWDPAYMPMYTFDNPLSEYVMDGGKLLYSSEEMIGTWFDWPTYQDFAPGHFMYDVLEVNWAANDFGLDSLISDPNGEYTAEMGNFNLNSGDFAFGNMNDLCDPIGFWPGTAEYQPPFQSYEGEIGWGVNPNSARTWNTVFLAFSMMQIPDDLYATFMGTWLGTVAIDETSSTLPTEFALANNYPNPFNPSTTIAFDVPSSNEVLISVYNVLGQKVIDLVNSEYSAGTYNVTWNGLNAAGTPVSSGVYVYRMTSGNFTASSKMLFLK